MKVEIHSYCLPCYHDGLVDFFDTDKKRHLIPESQFEDITTDGGRFHQFYTFIINKGGQYDVRHK